MTRLYFRQVSIPDLPKRYFEPLKALTIPGFLMRPMFEECLAEGEGRVVIAFANTTPVGWCLLTPFAAPEGKVLGAFFVHPDWRMKGIGRVLSDIARSGEEKVIFRANDGNRGFFESVGMIRKEVSTVAS